MDPKHITWNDGYQEWEKGGGVRLTHVRQAIEQPDDMETINFENLLVRMFKKRVVAGHAPYTIHAICPQKGDDLSIQSAVKVYDDVAAGIETLKPVDMLAAFVESLQTPGVVLAGESYRIVVMQSLRLKKVGEMEFGITQPPKGGGGIFETVFYFRLSEDQTTMHVAHAWAIDFAAYRRYLLQHM